MPVEEVLGYPSDGDLTGDGDLFTGLEPDRTSGLVRVVEDYCDRGFCYGCLSSAGAMIRSEGQSGPGDLAERAGVWRYVPLVNQVHQVVCYAKPFTLASQNILFRGSGAGSPRT